MSRLLWFVPGLVACGSFASAFSASEAVALASCERAFACEQDYPADREVAFATLWGESLEACQRQIAPDPAFESAWKTAEKDGSLSYDKAAAKVCTDALEFLSCGDFWSQSSPDSCAQAVTGSVAKDGECGFDAMCQSGLCDGGRCIGGTEED